MKKNKKVLNIFLIGILVLGIGALFYFSQRQTFFYTNNQLKGYTNANCNLRETPCTTEAYLEVPINSKNISFQLAPNIEAYSNVDSILNMKYSAFNFKTKKYEQIYSKTYNVKSGFQYYFAGNGIYNSNKIIKIVNVYGNYWKYAYYACLPGMENQLPPTLDRGTHGTKYICVYPGQTFSDSESQRTYEIMKPINLNLDFIQNGKVQLKIEGSTSGKFASPINPTDFWVGDVKYTLFPESKENFYELSYNQCNQISILPSEKTDKDFETKKECKSHISTESQTNQTGLIINDTTNLPIISKTNNYSVYISISIILLILFFLYLKSKKRVGKRRK